MFACALLDADITTKNNGDIDDDGVMLNWTITLWPFLVTAGGHIAYCEIYGEGEGGSAHGIIGGC